MSFPPDLPPEDDPMAGLQGMAELSQLGQDPGLMAEMGGGMPPGMPGMPPGMGLPAPVQQPLEGPFGAPGQMTRKDAMTATSVMPYTLPVVPRHTKPKVDWIIRQRESRSTFNEERNMAMLLDEQAYVMAAGSGVKDDADGGEEVINSNIISSFVNKLCFMVGRQDDKIEVKARSEGDDFRVAAQMNEDFLYEARRVSERLYRAQGHQGLGHDESYYAVVRGWIAYRAYADAQSDFPYFVELKDPFNCYPAFGMTGAGFMRNMIHYEETTVGDFLSNNPWAADDPYFTNEETGDMLDDDHDIKVTWYEDAFYSIVLLEAASGQVYGLGPEAPDVEGPLYGADPDDLHPAPHVLVDEEHEYGFCPWIMVPCNGTPSRAKGSRAMNGSGLIRPNRGIIAAFNRLLSQVHTNIAMAANPATIDYYGGPDTAADSQMPDALKFSPGARSVRDLSQGQRSEVLQTQPRPDLLAMLYQEYTKQLDRGTILNVLWGTPEGVTGGFHMSVAKNAAEDALFPVTDAVISARQMCNELLLNLVLAFDRLGLTDPAAVDRPGQTPRPGVRVPRRNRGRRRFEQAPLVWGILEPEHVKLNGVANVVKLRRMTPQDLLQMVQSAVMASQAKVLSLDWVRREWLDIDDPAEMNEWIIYEATLSDPDVMRGFYLPQVLERYDPALAQWFQQQTMMKMMGPQGMPGQAGGTPPGAMPPGGPGAGPGANPPDGMVSNQMLPMEMQAGQPMPGGQGDPEQIMAMIDAIIQNGGTP